MFLGIKFSQKNVIKKTLQKHINLLIGDPPRINTRVPKKKINKNAHVLLFMLQIQGQHYLL